MKKKKKKNLPLYQKYNHGKKAQLMMQKKISKNKKVRKKRKYKKIKKDIQKINHNGQDVKE